MTDPLAVLGGDIHVPSERFGPVRYANFDVAATAPCLSAAADAVSALLPYYASVHRGAGALSQRCTLAYERARQVVADFLGCGPEDSVVFTRNTTDATNLLAHALPEGTHVVTFAGEHHANLLPWPDVTRLPLPGTPAEAVQRVDEALRSLGRPSLVAVTGASNVTGEVWPVARIAAVAHQYGARVVLDAAQLAAHQPVDMAALGVDYVVLSGHKLYAPFGTGVLAGRADWLDAAPPYLRGGGASQRVGDAPGDVVWHAGPARHEAGTPNLLGAVALAAVCTALEAADRHELAAREEALLVRLREGLDAIGRVHQLSLFDEEHPRVGIVSFAVEGQDSATVAARLSIGFGIGVRDGMFCAHPLTRHLLARRPVALPGTAVRASLGLGTTPEHVDRLLTALDEIAASGRGPDQPAGAPVCSTYL
jgi:selenocysteine lyase/cysteine desulfurase